jgi:hypothetical protein
VGELCLLLPPPRRHDVSVLAFLVTAYEIMLRYAVMEEVLRH